eukprot:TRINITY_DN29018_c0_g1_i1.p1 TRINITY_DN29018_c0_g1~~TRINITY_DN29018_c0_g1_i1.p1  ORF type:complete len:367 (+),score=56.45 TRINITY_DN29018_c0_g1_i1:149-1249(+)
MAVSRVPDLFTMVNHKQKRGRRASVGENEAVDELKTLERSCSSSLLPDVELEQERIRRKVVDVAQACQHKMDIYLEIEMHWRKISFYVALTLGILPVVAGASHMLPEVLSGWFGLLISVINVVVVVTNVKMDIGERIADASMARKGYQKLVSDCTFFVHDLQVKRHTDANMYSQEACRLFTELRAITDSIHANMTYAAPRPSRRPSKNKIHNLSGERDGSIADDAKDPSSLLSADGSPTQAGCMAFCDPLENVSLAVGATATASESGHYPDDDRSGDSCRQTEENRWLSSALIAENGAATSGQARAALSAAAAGDSRSIDAARHFSAAANSAGADGAGLAAPPSSLRAGADRIGVPKHPDAGLLLT